VDKPQALENFPIARIVGGTTAVRGEFPAFVQIWIDGIEIGGTPDLIYPFCGASLIQSNKVLTAAHCTNDFSTGNLYALPEFYSFNDSITFSDLIPVATKAVHSNFNDSTLDSDVSVLTLSSHSGTALTSVYGGSDQLTGDSATVVGTGLLSQVGSSPDTLQKVTVPIVSNSVCKTSYGAVAITGNIDVRRAFRWRQRFLPGRQWRAVMGKRKWQNYANRYRELGRWRRPANLLRCVCPGKCPDFVYQAACTQCQCSIRSGTSSTAICTGQNAGRCTAKSAVAGSFLV
jgi:hypothetical protein